MRPTQQLMTCAIRSGHGPFLRDLSARVDVRKPICPRCSRSGTREHCTILVSNRDTKNKPESGNTSVDFAFDTNARWLVEAYSLAETEAAVAATWNREEFFGRVLSSPRSIGTNETLTKAERKRRLEEQKQSVEGETLQAVERLLSKVSDGKFPLKFPPPSANTYSMLAVDIRSLFRGHADRGDLDQIAYGASAVPERYRCFWPGRDGKLLPIRGIFDSVNTSTKARHFRERVHFLTFVLERTYERAELAQIGYYVANPHLFESHDSAKDAFATFPLNRKARREKAA